MPMDAKFIRSFKDARNSGAPLLAVRTSDPAATINTITQHCASNGNSATPMVSWDCVAGFRGLNEMGRSVLASRLGERPPESFGPAESLLVASGFDPGSILFMLNGHRFLSEPPVMQAAWNLRDQFKSNKRTLVILCPQITLPAELCQDFLVLDEPLPTIAELSAIVRSVYDAGKTVADLPQLTENIISQSTDALCGLAAFPAEQTAAMSLSKTGYDLTTMWERKRTQIEQTPGLSVWRGGETFNDIGGCDNVKTFLSRVISGEESPRAVVFIDEIEKAMGGASGDTSGVSQGMLGTLLTWMQDHAATGCIFIGPPGAAKSAIAKATGNTAGVPTIAFDLTGMKNAHIGESELNLRNALAVVNAVSQGRTLFIATCNSIGVLPPELRRRFSFGTFFFDLPNAEERKAIWKIYVKKFKLEPYAPNDSNWTGAEIRQCCDLAHRLKCSLVEASKYIVPVARSAADSIRALRVQASGRFISASSPNVYEFNENQQSNVGRSIEVQ